MVTETVEEFLARGGKVSRSTDKDISLTELLKKEGLMDASDSKKMESSISNSIIDSLNSEFKQKTDKKD